MEPKPQNGYRVSLVTKDLNGSYTYKEFIGGWLNDATQAAWGRPVDVITLQDGSLLISDDKAGALYRVSRN